MLKQVVCNSVFLLCLGVGSMNVHAALVFFEDYPDASSLNLPSAGAVQVAGASVLLTKTGSFNDLEWLDGVGDGIAGPASGGVIYSTQRVEGVDPFAYLIYQFIAPAGQLISDSQMTVHGHTPSPVGFDITIESSVDGSTWENSTVMHSDAGLNPTLEGTTDQTGLPAYQGLSSVYYRITMPTFLSTVFPQAAVDDVAISGNLVPVPEPASVALLLTGTFLTLRRKKECK